MNKKSLVFIVVLFIFSIHNPLVAQEFKTAVKNSPRLVLVINVEQMRTDYLVRYRSKFQNGGFLRILNNGAVFSNARLNLQNQKRIVGAASLFSGTTPDRNGIVGKSWYDRLKKEEISAIDDDYYITVGSDSEQGQRSSKNLLVPTLGDIMKLSTTGQSKVFSVGLDDYSVVLSAGHTGDGAYWLDEKTGKMISSSYFVEQFPSWILDFNQKKFADEYLQRDWTTLLPLKSYTESIDDNYLLEKGYYNKWNTFPYKLEKLKHRAGSYKVLKTTPFGNDLVSDFSIDLLEHEKLGLHNVPDLFIVNFSSMDYENSSFGPASVEMEDTYLRLDQNIAHLLDVVDQKVGLAHTLVVLTSDCSSSYSVDYLKEEFNLPVGYVSPLGIVALLKSYLNITYGQGDWVEYSGNQQIYLNHDLIEQKKIDLSEIEQKVAVFINQFSGVKWSVPASILARGQSQNSQLQSMSDSYNFKRSGDVLYMLEYGWQPEFKYKRAEYTDNNHIPLIFMGSQIKKGKYSEKVDAVSIVPTILDLLQMEIPGSCQGSVLEKLKK